MKKCPICKGEMVEELLDYDVQLEDGREVRLEEVPTWVCERCDHTIVDEAVIETVEDMLDHLDELEGGEAALSEEE
ncbi:MAG: YgiT-type zinc finger protein [Candidatus Promineifilaceae bacterium]